MSDITGDYPDQVESPREFSIRRSLCPRCGGYGTVEQTYDNETFVEMPCPDCEFGGDDWEVELDCE